MLDIYSTPGSFEEASDKTNKDIITQREFGAKKVEKLLTLDFTHPFEIYLKEELNKNLIGQDEAKKIVIDTIVQNLVAHRPRKGPLGVLYFAGPTGVGKTEMVKALAKAIFGNSNAFTKISCENYQEQHTGRTLFGSPKSYLGYGEPTPLDSNQVYKHFDTAKKLGKLHDMIKQIDGFNIILFDEIEKAHSSIHQSLLSLLDDARIEFPDGKVARYNNSIIIFTSNVGQNEISDLTSRNPFGFVQSSETQLDKETDNILKKSIKQTFSPEFLGRLDSIISFESISKDDCKKIIDIHLDLINDYLKKYYKHSDISVCLSEDIYDFVIEKGYSKEKGARELIRIFESKIESKLNMLFRSEVFENYLYMDTPVQVKIVMGEGGEIQFLVNYYESQDVNGDSQEEDVIGEELSLPVLYNSSITNSEKTSFLNTFNNVFSLMSQYVELNYISMDGEVDFRSEVRSIEKKLKNFGLTKEDIENLKNRAYVETLREYAFIDDFRGIDLKNDTNNLFSPFSPVVIDKIIKCKINSIAKDVGYKGKNHEEITIEVLDYVLKTVSKLFNGKELTHEQINELILRIRKVYTEKFLS